MRRTRTPRREIRIFHSLFDPLPLGIIVIDENRQPLYANPFVFTIMGLENNVQLPSLDEMFPALDLTHLSSTPHTAFFRTDLQTSIKSFIPITITTYPILLAEKKRTIIAFLDQVSTLQIQTLFHEVNTLTSSLAEERYSFEHLLHQLQSGILWGNQEEIWYINSRVESLIGFSPLSHCGIVDIFVNREKITYYLKKRIPITNLEAQLMTKNGAISCLVHISFLPYHQKDGWLIEIMNIEDKKQIENSIMDIAQSFLQERNELRKTQQSINQELRLAREIQFSLLPHQQYPSLTYLYVPMEEIGGDFLDILPLNETSVGIFISDVCGHGIAASLLTVMIKQKLMELKAIAFHPALLLTALNKSLFHQLNGYFFTAIYAVYQPHERILTIANAGHPHPFWQQERYFGTLGTERAQPIGIFPSIVYQQRSIIFRPGERILFYTDGFLETTNKQMENFEENSLVLSCSRHGHKNTYDFLHGLLNDLKEFHGHHHLDDDVAFICLDVT